MSSFGKCQSCEALGKLEEVGTLDPETMRPVVMKLCRGCAPKYLHVNRKQRRDITQGIERAERQVAKWGKVKPKKVRLPDDAKRIRPRKPSPILLPKQEPETVPSKPKTSPIILPGGERSKEGILLP